MKRIKKYGCALRASAFYSGLPYCDKYTISIWEFQCFDKKFLFGYLYSGEGKEKRFTPLVKGERATKWRGDSMERIPQSFFGL